MNRFNRLRNKKTVPTGLPDDATFPEQENTFDPANRYRYDEARYELIAPQTAALGHPLPEDPNDPSFMDIVEAIRRENPALAAATMSTRYDTLLDATDNYVDEAQRRALAQGQFLRRLRAPFMTKNAAGKEVINKTAAILAAAGTASAIGIAMLFYNPNPTVKTAAGPTIVGSPVNNADGSQTVTYSDGSTVTTYGDGTTITTNTRGERITKSKDGTITIEYSDRRRVVTKPDDTSIEYLTDGSTITRNALGQVTSTTPPNSNPDGIATNPNASTPTNTLTPNETTPSILSEQPEQPSVTTNTPTNTLSPTPTPSSNTASTTDPYASTTPDYPTNTSTATPEDPNTGEPYATSSAPTSTTTSTPYPSNPYTGPSDSSSGASSNTPTNTLGTSSAPTPIYSNTATSGTPPTSTVTLSNPNSSTAPSATATTATPTGANTGTAVSNLPATGVNQNGQPVDQNGQPTMNQGRVTATATPSAVTAPAPESITVMRPGAKDGTQSQSGNAASNTNQSSSQGGQPTSAIFRKSVPVALTTRATAPSGQNGGSTQAQSGGQSVMVFRKASTPITTQRFNQQAQRDTAQAQAQTAPTSPYAPTFSNSTDTGSNTPTNTLNGVTGQDTLQTQTSQNANNILGGVTPQAQARVPYRTGQRMYAKLSTGIFVAQNAGSLPVYAETADGTLWRGNVTFDPTKRLTIIFDHASLATGEEIVIDAAAYHMDGTPGLPAKYHDISPTLANDLIRASLSGVKDYVDAKLQATTTSTAANGTTIVQRPLPQIGESIAASATGVFALPANQNTFVTVAEIPVGTQFALIYGPAKASNKN